MWAGSIQQKIKMSQEISKICKKIEICGENGEEGGGLLFNV